MKLKESYLILFNFRLGFDCYTGQKTKYSFGFQRMLKKKKNWIHLPIYSKTYEFNFTVYAISPQNSPWVAYISVNHLRYHTIIVTIFDDIKSLHFPTTKTDQKSFMQSWAIWYTNAYTGAIDYLIDFSGISTCLGLTLYTLRLGNCIQCPFIFIFFVYLFLKSFFSHDQIQIIFKQIHLTQKWDPHRYSHSRS